MERTNSSSVVAIAASILIAVAVCCAVGQNGTTVGSVPVFWLCGLLAFLINWLAFIPANLAKTERYYDLVGSLTYLSIIGVAVIFTAELDTRSMLAAVMVTVWALRLGTFLFLRISKDGHDDRFDEIKVHAVRFLSVWTIQGLWALLTAACALAIITSASKVTLEWVGKLGVFVWCFGFLIEVVADAQKRAFKGNPENSGRFISTGLWSWSQHPNYFGEIILWLGMAIMALPVLNDWQWVALISPVFVYLLLTRVSGIPMLAAKAEKRWGSETEYQQYVSSTSKLIPRPPTH